MKSNFLVVLVVTGATGSLMSMEQKNNDPSRLNFVLSQRGYIKKYSAENMEYAVQPSEFVNKKITKVIPLSEHDRKAVEKALEDAVQKQTTITVPYTLENKQFFATITPLICIKKNEKRNSFFVKVTPDNLTNQ